MCILKVKKNLNLLFYFSMKTKLKKIKHHKYISNFLFYLF